MVGLNEIMLSMLFLIPNSESKQALQQHTENIMKEQKVIHINLINTYDTYKKHLAEEEIKKIQEQIRLEKEEEDRRIAKEEKELKKSKQEAKEKEFILTFYTSLPSENGGYTITCEGKKLRSGMVASNHYSLGTKIKLDGYGTVTVSDRGSSRFNKNNRLDVLVPRKKGESDSKYLKRVNDMGVVKVKGRVLSKN